MQPSQGVIFTVIGTPAPQGSKRHVGGGKLIESSKQVKPWRESVVWAAREKGISVHGAVIVELLFSIHRPKGIPKKTIHAVKKPDIDKLTRSTLDGLKTAGVIQDDSCVVRLVVDKRYVGHPANTLDVPGAIIRVFSALPLSSDRLSS